MAKDVTGEVLIQNYELQKKFNEFQRQINQNGGYPFDFDALLKYLQDGVDGKFPKGKFYSKLLLKTTTLHIKKCEGFEVNKENIKTFFASVYENEPSFFINNDFLRYLSGESFNGVEKDFTTTIYRYQSKLTFERVLNEAERTRIKKIYSFMEGLSIIREFILSREINKGSNVSIFIEIVGCTGLFTFNVYRGNSGALVLDFGIIENFYYEYGINCGVFFDE